MVDVKSFLGCEYYTKIIQRRDKIMKKEIKIVDGNKMEAIVSKVGSRRKVLISKAKDGSKNMSFKVGIVASGIDIRESFESDTVHYMLKGKAIIEWDGNEIEFTDGMAIYMPAGSEIRYRAEEETDVISVWSPALE